MNINQLRFVCAVSKTDSFSRAAEACHVTQPALSNAIAQFEAEIGGRLFERTTRRVNLTPFGRHIMPSVVQAIDAVEDLRSSARAFLDPAVKIARIGLSPIVDMKRVADRLEPFRAAHPDVEIFFKQCYLDDLEQRLQDGLVDIGLWPAVGHAGSALIDAPFYSEPLMFLPSEASPESGPAIDPVPLPAVTDETFVLTADVCGLVRTVHHLFRRAGKDLNIYPGHALDYETMQVWADLGIGSALLPASKLRADAAARARLLNDTDGSCARMRIVASWSRSKETAPHIKALRQLFGTADGGAA